MPSIAKPVAVHPSLHRNAIGLNLRDYEGAMSTLCAGCGHDSITAAITRSLWELSIEPHMIAKLSGIGCSSKTPTYFVSGAHGFNSAHGRMAAIATGAIAANRELTGIGRRRLQEQTRRAEPHGAHRSGHAGPQHRSDLRRAQFFRR